MVADVAGRHPVTFRINTLSMLDCTILTPVCNANLLEELRIGFEKQGSSLGYGKEVYGVFEAVKINTVTWSWCQLFCSLCKTTKVRRYSRTEGHRFLCNVPVPVLEVPRLQGKITMPNRLHIDVALMETWATRCSYLVCLSKICTLIVF